MTELTSAMDIDVDENQPRKSSNMGKDVAGFGGPPQSKATPWVEKYRPQSLDDVAAHRDIIDTIDRLTNENRLPHLLLYGPPGTGKTSTILAVARKLYGPKYRNMILELNASDDRGIDVVRQQIQDFASTQSFSLGKSSVKLVLLDEADAMTKDAQFALRRVIEKYTKSTRFAPMKHGDGSFMTSPVSETSQKRGQQRNGKETSPGRFSDGGDGDRLWGRGQLESDTFLC